MSFMGPEFKGFSGTLLEIPIAGHLMPPSDEFLTAGLGCRLQAHEIPSRPEVRHVNNWVSSGRIWILRVATKS